MTGRRLASGVAWGVRGVDQRTDLRVDGDLRVVAMLKDPAGHRQDAAVGVREVLPGRAAAAARARPCRIRWQSLRVHCPQPALRRRRRPCAPRAASSLRGSSADASCGWPTPSAHVVTEVRPEGLDVDVVLIARRLCQLADIAAQPLLFPEHAVVAHRLANLGSSSTEPSFPWRWTGQVRSVKRSTDRAFSWESGRRRISVRAGAWPNSQRLMHVRGWSADH